MTTSPFRCLTLIAVLCTILACGTRQEPDAHADDGNEHRDEAGGESVAHGEEGGHEEGEGAAREVRVPLEGLRGLAFVRVGEPQEEGV